MSSRQLFRVLSCAIALASFALPALAVDIVLDYRYDSNNFFNPGTANGMAGRATLSAAADFFSTRLSDTLNAIPFTDPNTPGQDNTPVWRQVIMHPGTGASDYEISSAANDGQDGLSSLQGPADEYRNIEVPANQLIIYVGGTGLSQVGIGGTGVGYFGSTSFNDNIARRGEFIGQYSTWGGYVAFDNDGSTTWHYDYATPVAVGKIDLYSVALHEIGHVLGLNTNGVEWNNQQDGATWEGPLALAAWKADDPSASPSATGVPTVSTTDHHWKDNLGAPTFAPQVRSKVLGTNTLQEAAMDASIMTGTRKHFTNLDMRALQDIGWEINESWFQVTTQSYEADFNDDGAVDAADYLAWRRGFSEGSSADADADGDSDGADFLFWQRQRGLTSAVAAGAGVPEPSSALLLALGGLAFACRQFARRPENRRQSA